MHGLDWGRDESMLGENPVFRRGYCGAVWLGFMAVVAFFGYGYPPYTHMYIHTHTRTHTRKKDGKTTNHYTRTHKNTHPSRI